jgi:hypothetical protein
MLGSAEQKLVTAACDSAGKAWRSRRAAGHRRHLSIRGDSAAATHAELDWLTGQNTARRVQYSLGWSIGEPERTAISTLPASAWSAAINADGGVRDGARVAELTGLLHLPGWPAGMRAIVRRERPHPGAQLSLFEEADGWRYTAFVTNTQVGALQWLEVRHRAHARVEDRIGCAKDTGLRRLPSREFAINQALCIAAAIAADLICWLQLHAPDGGLARVEPKRLRYRLLHTAARLARGQRRRWLRIPSTWALGHPDHRRARPDRGDPRTRLTRSAADPTTGGPGDHAHRRDRRPLSMPRPRHPST